MDSGNAKAKHRLKQAVEKQGVASAAVCFAVRNLSLKQNIGSLLNIDQHLSACAQKKTGSDASLTRTIVVALHYSMTDRFYE